MQDNSLKAHIAHEGAISLAGYMALCLGHPEYGYYQKQQPFGAGGDFITAPELTPVFGEMVGIWLVDQWQRMGEPLPLNIIELGAGTGILMSDVLRVVSRLAPALLKNAQIHVVETSTRLRDIQAETLAAYAPQLHWHDTIQTIPHGHCIFIANEFFDALPIHQYIYRNGIWNEHCIGLNAEDNLEWKLQPRAEIPYPFPSHLNEATEGAIIEYCPAAEGVTNAISERLKRHTGACLFVDYGYTGPAFGGTFQAVRKHEYINPLECPGEADLTAHVDFGALALWAEKAGVKAQPLITQSEFLQSMGIIARYEQAMPTLSPDKQALLTSAVERLLSPEQMGSLFKVLVINSPKFISPVL